MASFFINRPIFAWVIALFIMVLGCVAITQLPVAQYPPVAPPSIVVTAAYPGASAQTLEDAVLSVIEREMNGAPGLIYMESVAQSDGHGTALRRAGRVIARRTVGGRDGDVIETDVASLDGLAREIAGYGPDVLVLEPDSLRSDVVARLTAQAGVRA